jgi:nitrogen fixation/metabolism regulation signal transduction histidine kinase
MTALTEILAQVRGTQATPEPVKAKETKASVELTPEQLLMVTQLAEARELMRYAKANEETAKAAILEALGDAVLGTDASGTLVVQINAGSRTGIDTDLLMTGFPEAYNLTRKTTPYRAIKILKPTE